MDVGIGELARRTGLTVKTVRFYSDRGLVPPCRRDASGRRRYDHEALSRLALIRTLRELGLDLATIGRVLSGEAGLTEVASDHVAALGVQVRVLRLRQAVLSRIASGEDPERVRLLLDLVAGERERLIEDFLDAVFAGCGPAYAGIRRSLTPELPEEPTAAQWDAWIELMSIVDDAEFRAGLRTMVAGHAAAHGPAGPPRRDVVAVARDLARPLLAAGVEPGSPRADAAVAALSARIGGSLPGAVATARDPRWDRYNELVSVVNGWAPGEPVKPALDWFARALAARG